jgi:hypothetical protein
MLDPLEAAICAGAIAALKSRASAQREMAAIGVSVVVHNEHPVTVITSEARAALKIAHDLEDIAAELAAEARP